MISLQSQICDYSSPFSAETSSIVFYLCWCSFGLVLRLVFFTYYVVLNLFQQFYGFYSVCMSVSFCLHSDLCCSSDHIKVSTFLLSFKHLLLPLWKEAHLLLFDICVHFLAIFFGEFLVITCSSAVLLFFSEKKLVHDCYLMFQLFSCCFRAWDQLLIGLQQPGKSLS